MTQTAVAGAIGAGPIATVRGWLLAATIFLVIPTVSVSSTDEGPDTLWALSVMCAFLLLLLCASSVAWALRRRPLLWAAWASWGLAAAMLASLLFNRPTTQLGVFWTVSAIVAAAAACAMAEMPPQGFARLVVAPLLAASAIQGVLMAAQLITGRPIGVDRLLPGVALEVIDDVLRAQGTFVHVFEPALFATIALAAAALAAPNLGKGVLWPALTSVAAVPVALSYSRSALLSALTVVGCLLLAHRRRTPGARTMAVAISAGLIVAGLFVAPGWLTRLDQSTSGDADDVTLGRITLARQALEMIGDHPILGVGTAKYIPTLETDYEPDPEHPFAVHNFPLRVTAEVGIPLGILVVALAVAAGVQAVRAGPLPAAAYLAMVPWLLFDILYYDRVYGLLVFGLWWGVVAQATAGGHTSLATRSA